MTALAATDFTVTISQRNIEDRPGFLRRVFADLTFGDDALTYPSGGIPLPAKTKFGFKRAIVLGIIEQPVNGFVYKFDRTNHTLLIYTQGFITVGTGTTKVSTADTLPYIKQSYGSTTLTVGQVIPGASVASTTYDIGPLIELPTTAKPSATTVRMEFVGE